MKIIFEKIVVTLVVNSMPLAITLLMSNSKCHNIASLLQRLPWKVTGMDYRMSTGMVGS